MPNFLIGRKGIRITNLNDYDTQFLELYSYLTGQTLYPEPPLGPVVSIEELKKETAILDIKAYQEKTKLQEYTYWDFRLSLEDFVSKPLNYLYMRVQKYFFFRRSLNLTSFYPNILSPCNLKSNTPATVFESGDYVLSISNQRIYDKLVFLENRLLYGLVELNDFSEGQIVNMRFSVLNILYLLLLMKKFHTEEKLKVNIQSQFRLESSTRAYYNFGATLFRLNYDILQAYLLANNRHTFNQGFSDLDKETLFDFFQILMAGFVSENPRSTCPFLHINFDDFSQVYDTISSGKYEY